MTTIVEVLNRAARQLSISAPSSWITATEDTYAEIRDDFLRQTVDDIVDRFDWPSPVSAEVTISGTGVETYALPADFLRIQRIDMAVHDSSFTRYTAPEPDDAYWADMRQNGVSGADRVYRISGYDEAFEISLLPLLSEDLTVHYVTNYWMVSDAGVLGTVLTADTDKPLFPPRLIETGIVWRWRERRGLPYDDKHGEYEAIMHRARADIRGIRSISFGPRKQTRWQDRVPAYIPPA